MPQIFKLFSVLPLPTTSRALLRLSTSCFWFYYTHKFTDHLGFLHWSFQHLANTLVISVFSLNVDSSFSFFGVYLNMGFFSLNLDMLRFSFNLESSFLSLLRLRNTSLLSTAIDSCFFCWPTLFNNKGLTCSLPPGHWENVIDIVIGKKHQIKTQTNKQEHTLAYQECNDI